MNFDIVDMHAMRVAVARRVSELGVTLTAFYTIVIVVAGASGIALLAWPANSGSFFAWHLGAAPTAATIGALYLASVPTFAAALVRPRRETRSLNRAVLALAVPTLWFTLVHRDVFDWSRPQAIGWVLLFMSAPITIALELRAATDPGASQRATRWTRATLAVVALASAAGAIALWAEPIRSAVAPNSPIPLVGLTSRYLGAWCAFLATAAATAAAGGRRSEARLVAVLLGSVSFAALVAVVRTFDDVGPNVGVHVGTITALGIVAALLHRANRTTLGWRGATPSARHHTDRRSSRTRTIDTDQPDRIPL